MPEVAVGEVADENPKGKLTGLFMGQGEQEFRTGKLTACESQGTNPSPP